MSWKSMTASWLSSRAYRHHTPSGCDCGSLCASLPGAEPGCSRWAEAGECLRQQALLLGAQGQLQMMTQQPLREDGVLARHEGPRQKGSRLERHRSEPGSGRWPAPYQASTLSSFRQPISWVSPRSLTASSPAHSRPLDLQEPAAHGVGQPHCERIHDFSVFGLASTHTRPPPRK